MRSLGPSLANSLAPAFIFLLIIILVATDFRGKLHPNPSWVVGFPTRNQEPHYNAHNYYYVGQPRQGPRTHSLLDAASCPLKRPQLCDHIEMIRRHQQKWPFPPPPPPRRSNKGSHDDNDHEIDPRYGVEKRLVPSGPNPLHN